MADGERIRFVFAAACVAAAVSVTVLYVQRRQRRRGEGAVVGLSSSELDGKPQSKFERVLADNSFMPFFHLKLHGNDEKGTSIKTHPYEEEISNLLEHPQALEFMTGHENSNINSSYVWISTDNDLKLLVRKLSKEQVFAVDTEQHSVRSFLGFTALMQISTAEEDFLIDTIALHDVMSILRPVFADPSICKVFHGADNDILWLQRDFHIYVVNMFDTAKACEVLSKQQKSLAYLLETYCGVTTDKTLQREDWRIRPLSEEMLQYARSDAHYLLYIADCLVAELRNRPPDNAACPEGKLNFLFEASRRSSMICMQLYAKDVETPPGASVAASLFARNFNFQGETTSETCEVKDILSKLSAWRDVMARVHDESLRYILSDQALVALAAKRPTHASEISVSILEADMSNGSINSFYSFPSPSPIVSMHMKELCCLLQGVKANLDDLFRGYMQKQSDCATCSVSIYNHVLLSQLESKHSKIFSKQTGGKLNAPNARRSSRELFVQKFSCKSPVYHNCRIYANDGRLLCYCDRRKLEWYLRRSLARLIEDEPPAIILLFEPKGRPEDDGNDFYIQSKKNICVGCGEKNHYLRYRIIPSCYRMYFPEHLKSHRSHDIVLLCVDCHEIAHSAAEKYKKQIAAEFEVPLFVEKIVGSGKDEVIDLSSGQNIGERTGVPPLQLRTAAMALLRHGSTMPSKRRDELTQIVRAFFGGREITHDDLEMALFVGMSPHERRRLEKKKGLHFRHYEGSTSKLTTETRNGDKVTDDVYSSKSSDILSSNFGGEERGSSAFDLDVDSSVDEDTSPRENKFESFNERETVVQETINKSSNGSIDCTLPHENGASHETLRPQVPSCNTKKLSLLGHGPHGKQVVEHILMKYGEEGINQFCQRWRQVFVEAIRPRFLPAGWDVMHSGRRDFGDYSVYNPAKRSVGSADN